MSDAVEITDEHLKLLRRAYVRWEDCEYGAPSIDCKRPYGNSDVLRDIAQILDVEWDDDAWENGGLDAEAAARLRRLHEETETALQVMLQCASLRPGHYVSHRYGQWKPAESVGEEGRFGPR